MMTPALPDSAEVRHQDIDSRSVRARDRKMAWWRVSIFCGLALLAWNIFTSQVRSQPATVPQYTANGELMAPVGYKGWVFVGSNLGLAYRRELSATTEGEASRADPPRFHNVYINQEAYAHFLTSREFPDRTILVMEIFVAADKEPKGILATGLYNGQRVGLEVAVKNMSRPDGQTTPWAYYDFTDDADSSKMRGSAPAFADQSCETCHRQHASRDNVWVQFYPTLRDQ